MINVNKIFLKISYAMAICVYLSSCSSNNTLAPVVNIQSKASLKTSLKNVIQSSQYIVRSGETLYSIAWRANSDVRNIAQLNKLVKPYRIYPGQKLVLSSSVPAKASASIPHTKKWTKNPTIKQTKEQKNTIASTKKQVYGKNRAGEKTNKKVVFKTAKFSQKIRHWQWPVKGRIIETFSTKVQGNKGLNISGRRGTKIKAAADGKVVYAGSALRGYGKLIIIKHNDDYLSAYAHNDKILVKEQQLIKSGEIVAKMGDSDAEKVMLHFEIRFRGKSVNPLKYLPK